METIFHTRDIDVMVTYDKRHLVWRTVVDDDVEDMWPIRDAPNRETAARLAAESYWRRVDARCRVEELDHYRTDGDVCFFVARCRLL